MNLYSQMNIEVFQNYEDSTTDGELQFDQAFESLLDQRSKPINEYGILEALSGDEKLATMNLQTAHLFKTLSEKFKTNTCHLEKHRNTIQEFKEHIEKIEGSSNRIKAMSLSHGFIEDLDTSYDGYKKTAVKAYEITLRELSKKIQSLEEENEVLTKQLNSIRTLILTGVNELLKPEDQLKKMCPVCFDSEVCMALVPCGHTYCRPCAEMDRSRSAKCPQCRSVINTRVKIFFSI